MEMALVDEGGGGPPPPSGELSALVDGALACSVYVLKLAHREFHHFVSIDPFAFLC
jgi:hypothetical protein